MNIYDEQDKLESALKNISNSLDDLEKEDPDFYAELVKICEDNKAH